MTDDNDNKDDPEPPKKVPELSPIEAMEAGAGEDGGVKESLLFGSGLSAEDIAKAAAASDWRRSEWFKNSFEILAILALVAAFFVFMAVCGVWFWHLLTPDTYHFLPPEQVKTVQSIATGSIFAGLATGHIKKRLG